MSHQQQHFEKSLSNAVTMCTFILKRFFRVKLWHLSDKTFRLMMSTVHTLLQSEKNFESRMLETVK